MNDTTATTVAPPPNTTYTYTLDDYYAMYINPITVIRFYQIGYPITFLLGFLGNAASLLTFSRPTLRKVSTGCLFIVLALSDTLFLIMHIFDFVEFGLQISFYHHVPYYELCRFRSFVISVCQFLSGWTLVVISLDRWIRTRFPFKSGWLCTPKNALLVTAVVLVIDAGVYSHLLSQLYGMLIPGFSFVACGPTIYSGNYFVFYFLTWSVVQVLIICLVPVAIMVVILIDIFICVRIRKRAVIQPAQNQQGDSAGSHQRNLQLQMFILMLASIGIFLVTTLPVAMYKITAAREQNVTYEPLKRVSSIWTALGWFQTLNYAVNFYVHCLSSTLFRKEFLKRVGRMVGVRPGFVNTMEMTGTGHRTRTQVH